ncbi:hypothetical protein DAPPUDRAFT_116669 [Daphnia pulex]|uniref:RRM domain-containing protein n=1 Tax=Daphnia pulex TaxID=6669 RepID=E9HQ33_DAPPU|nr:hypothetical protein DAPPUDRAFT_116669 [Daphnia pulex]|eukprot:EFX66152.1 hypothetical protein DAPPUDRAFT_116669 [Daphnia pulex]
MSKLYIGNLAAEANEAALRQLLQESGVGNVSSVLVKRGGYAFIDCPEQSTVDRAIEKLNELDARSTVAQKSLRKIEIRALLLLAGSFGNGRMRRRVKRLKPVAGSSIDPAAAAAAAAAGVVDKSRVAVGAGAGCCLTNLYGFHVGRRAFSSRWTTKRRARCHTAAAAAAAAAAKYPHVRSA